MNTKKYKVIKRNTLSHSVGDEIELTDEKAKALVGKVELIKEVVEPSKPKPKSKAKK